MLLGIRWIGALMFVFISSIAWADVPPINQGVPGSKPGDIIAPLVDAQIAAWCDFNKQIVVTRTNVLCAYKGKVPTPEAPSY